MPPKAARAPAATEEESERLSQALIESGTFTPLDPAKRLPLYKDAQKRIMTGLPQIALVQVQKFQVVRKRVQGMYVAFDDFNTGLRNTVWLSS